jgi:hypothetical protein
MQDSDNEKFTLEDYIAGYYPNYLESDQFTPEEWKMTWIHATNAAETFIDDFFTECLICDRPDITFDKSIQSITPEINEIFDTYLFAIEITSSHKEQNIITPYIKQFLERRPVQTDAAAKVWETKNKAGIYTEKIDTQHLSTKIKTALLTISYLAKKSQNSITAKAGAEGRMKGYDQLKEYCRKEYITAPPEGTLKEWKEITADKILSRIETLQNDSKKKVRPTHENLTGYLIDNWIKDLKSANKQQA